MAELLLNLKTGTVLAALICSVVPAAAELAPFSDRFEGTELDATSWEARPGKDGIIRVRDGSLRLISPGLRSRASVVSRRGDLNFFERALTVVWDLDPERAIPGPYAASPHAKVYCGLDIGGATRGGSGAAIGLTAWPEGYPKPARDAGWYYTLTPGSLMPGVPDAEWRLKGPPSRVVWTINSSTWRVRVEGTTFSEGRPRSRTGQHKLRRAKFAQGNYRLRLLVSPHVRSMEGAAVQVPGVLYTRAISVCTPETAERLFLARPVQQSGALNRTGPLSAPGVLDDAAKPAAGQYLFGVNYAGAEFAGHVLPGVEGLDYSWPTAEGLDYYAGKGILLVRLPVRWERLQPVLHGELDKDYLAGLVRSVRMMADRDMKVIIDLHNHMRYRGKRIGIELPLSAFTDAWRRIASILKDEPGIWGYGLMNEPYNTDRTWPRVAQAGIDGVRSRDVKNTIVVGGDSFSRAERWAKVGADLHRQLHDPARNLCYEAHVYFDNDGTGRYRDSYEVEINRDDALVHPMIGVARLKPFVEWLEANELKGLVGEIGVPANQDRDPRWLTVLDNVYAYLAEHGVPSAYWAAGSKWTAERSLAIEPRNGQDRPQIAVLLKHARAGLDSVPGSNVP